MRNPARIRAVIFDLDGTLADTLPLCVEAFRRAARPFCGRDLEDDEITGTFGPSEEGSVQLLAPGNGNDCLDSYVAHYEELHGGLRDPFDGIVELLEALAGHHIRLAVVTGKGPRTAEISLRILGLARFFEFVEVGWEHGPRKTHGMREILSKWDLEPSEVVYVGDSARDVVDAREVGIAVAAVAWAQMCNPAGLATERPDILFFNVADLSDWLKLRLCIAESLDQERAHVALDGLPS